MTKKNFSVNNNYMTFSFNFKASRLQELFIIPTIFNVTFEVVIVDDKNKSKEDIEKKSFIELQKINYFFETVLDNIIIFDSSDTEDTMVCDLLSNDKMVCPGKPTDDLIARLLHSKLSQITKDIFFIGKLTLSTNDAPYTFTFQPPDYNLPKLVFEYLPDVKCAHKSAWWNRNDGFTYEIIMPDEFSDSEEKFLATIEDPMAEFDLLINEVFSNKVELNTTQPAKIIQVEKWKPKKV